MVLILERCSLKHLALYKELYNKLVLDINCCQFSTEVFFLCCKVLNILILFIAYTYKERRILEFVLKGA